MKCGLSRINWGRKYEKWLELNEKNDCNCWKLDISLNQNTISSFVLHLLSQDNNVWNNSITGSSSKNEFKLTNGTGKCWQIIKISELKI